ncbi:MAG TPA: hypothetical protein VFC78_00940 [Tepidisphaeraceae bacterium]|nr:hypothetical protein [Tepidisphaeraceae bacterium]
MRLTWIQLQGIARAIFVFAILFSHPVSAGPPFITDDPDPVEYKHWEVYLFSIYTHTSGADSGQFPAVEVNYGVVPDVQLHLIAPLAFDREPGSAAHYGYGDTELGIKYRFVHETDFFPEIGVFPLVEVPTGDAGRGLGNGQTQLFVPLWLQKSFGKDKEWTTYGGGGFWYNPGVDHRDYFRLGWELQRDFGKNLTLGGEIYHETPSAGGGSIMGITDQHNTASVVGTHGHTAFNLGGYYNFDDHWHLLFSAGRDIDGPNRFSSYLGVQLTF